MNPWYHGIDALNTYCVVCGKTAGVHESSEGACPSRRGGFSDIDKFEAAPKWVRCINADHTPVGCNLELGRVYEVERVDTSYTPPRYFIKGSLHIALMPERFQVVPAPKTELVVKNSSATKDEDPEELRLRNILLAPAPNTCRCGAPPPCKYHP